MDCWLDYDEKLDRFISTVKLALARVPISDKPVVYKSAISGEFVQQSSGAKLRFPNVPIQIEVRGAGVKTVAPIVSYETPLRFLRAKVEHLKPDVDFPKGSTQIDVAVQNVGADVSSSNAISTQFVGIFDRAGIEYSMSGLMTGSPTPFDAKKQIAVSQYRFPLNEIPSRARPLFARFKATRNGSWPLGFSVRLRP